MKRFFSYKRILFAPISNPVLYRIEKQQQLEKLKLSLPKIKLIYEEMKIKHDIIIEDIMKDLYEDDDIYKGQN